MGKHTAPSQVAHIEHMLSERAREERIAQARSVHKLHPIAGKRSLSSRGERTETWQTKRHTPARKRDRAEYLDRMEARRAKEAMEAKAAVAADKAKHVERMADR